MAEDKRNQDLEQTRIFTPDFGNTFDDYGEYSEPTVEAPARPVKRKRHLKRLRFPRLVWVALFVALAVGGGLLAAKWGWMWADDVLALTRPDQFVEVVINENDDLDDITQTLKDVIFSSIVGAGVVSGISGGARQTALAHWVYFFTRERYTAQAVKYTHGELVAVGLVLQLAYSGRTTEAEAFAARLRGWGLAASMGDLGVPFGDDDVAAFMEYMCRTDEMKAAGASAIPKLRAALKAIER